MSVDLKAFEKLLRSKSATWSERAEEYRHCGLRAVIVSGDRVRNALCDDGAQVWLDGVFAQLPPDAVIMDADFDLLHMSFNRHGAGYMDSYHFIVASREWDALEEGAVIPEFVPVFRKPDTPLTLNLNGMAIGIPPIPEDAEGWLINGRYVVRRDGQIEDVFPDNEPKRIHQDNVNLFPYGINPAHLAWADESAPNVWTCENHPPGSEINDIPAGMACPVCKRKA